MKFALIGGERREAEKCLSGVCTGCEQPVIPKCGLIKVKHWAHKSQCQCDHWWENETEWHRAWKDNFPIECQEIRHKAENGEWHIADVKTNQGHILEFQHSFLKPEERQARNNFYGNNLVWVVDGNRRQRYKTQFFKALEEMNPINHNPIIRKVFLSFSQLLEEWVNGQVPVFFDFGEESALWCLIPTKADMWVHVAAIPRRDFIDFQNGIAVQGLQSFSDLMNFLKTIVFVHENPQQMTQHQTVQTITYQRPLMRRQVQIPSHLSMRQMHYFNRSGRGRL